MTLEIREVHGHVLRNRLLWWAVGAAATAVGVACNLIFDRMPQSEPIGAEDLVDAVAVVLIGAAGLWLHRRRQPRPLADALIAWTVLSGAVWLCGGLADALADGRPDPSVPAQLFDLANTVLFVPTFVLLVVGPMLLFPSGPPGGRWRLAGWVPVLGTLCAMVSILLAPGPLDEDVPAWGDNPLGVDRLNGILDALQVAGLILLLVSLPIALITLVGRLFRPPVQGRRVMAWFAVGMIPFVLPHFDTAWFGGEVAGAVIAFGGLMFAVTYPLLGPPNRSGRIQIGVRRVRNLEEA